MNRSNGHADGHSPLYAVAVKRRFFPRFPWFWRLQLLGWAGYGLVSFIAFSIYFEVYTPGQLAFYEATRVAMACGLTLLIRPFYRWLWARSVPLWAIGLASLAGSLACGVGLLISFRLIFMRWVNPFSRAGDVSTYPKSIVDYSMIFLVWSALYFGIKHWRDLQMERETITDLPPDHDSDQVRSPADPETAPLKLEDHVLLSTGQDSFFLKVKNIAYIESEAPYSRVCARDGRSSLILKSLKQWQERLPEAAFVRIHRSTIVNVDCVERLEPSAGGSYRVFLQHTERPVDMSRRYARQLKDRFSGR